MKRNSGYRLANRPEHQSGDFVRIDARGLGLIANSFEQKWSFFDAKIIEKCYHSHMIDMWLVEFKDVLPFCETNVLAVPHTAIFKSYPMTA